MESKRIYLFQPGEKEKIVTAPPISLLHLAAMLKEAEYDVKIIDTRVEDYRSVDLKNAIFCGITSYTGSQITRALEIAQFIRDNNPEVPIVWGGIHTSLLPRQTCEHPLVDVVVKGEGEETIVELARAFENASPLESVEGIMYKKNGEVVDNPDRPFMDMNKLPFLPYELLNLEKYDFSTAHLHTSRGCPHNCMFCYNRKYNKLSYRAKDPEKVLDEIERILKVLKPKIIQFNEDNFFVKKSRVKEICQGLIDRNLNITWSAQCRVDYFSRYDDDFIELLSKSGCDGLAFGAESGSQRTLDRISKGIRVEDTLNTVRKCKEHGIKPIFSIVIGFPGETKDDVYKTMDLIDERGKIDNHIAASQIFIYIPYPGTPLFDEAIKDGFKFPESLDEWGTIYFGDTTKIGFYEKKYARFLQTVFGIDKILFEAHTTKNPVKKLIIAILRVSGNIRWRFRFFKFPVEWQIFHKYTRDVGKYG